MTVTVADPWVAMGDPTRRRVYASLASRPQSVGELAAQLPVSRPAVSQHLRVLLDAGLITVQPQGRRRIHAVRPDGLASLRRELDSFWNAALTNFAALARTEEMS